jgi:DNA adenine methylase
MSSTTAPGPFLRWAGSKRAQLDELKAFVPVRFRRYVEPFAGSACMFFALRPPHATLGDLNAELITAYTQLRDSPEALISELATLDQDGADYYELRAVDPSELNPMQRATRFIYLNRHSFNGVYRTNRRGSFNVPRGTRVGRMPSASALRSASHLLQSTDLVRDDFSTAIDSATAGDFVYLDPPFSRSTAPHYGLYGYGSFSPQDEVRLASSLHQLDEAGAYFLLSYHDLPNVELPASWVVHQLTVRRQVSAQSSHRRISREIIITNVR